MEVMVIIVRDLAMPCYRKERDEMGADLGVERGKRESHHKRGNGNENEDKEDIHDEEAEVVDDNGGLADALVEVKDFVSRVQIEILQNISRRKI